MLTMVGVEFCTSLDTTKIVVVINPATRKIETFSGRWLRVTAVCVGATTTTHTVSNEISSSTTAPSAEVIAFRFVPAVTSDVAWLSHT